MNRTKIEYLDYTTNPITGCSGVGCAVRRECWAFRMSKRLRGRYGYPSDDPFKPTFHPERLDDPLKVKTPSLVGLCFMGDFFDKDVVLSWQAEVYAMIKRVYWHTFLILTKQPQNAIGFLPNPRLNNFWLGVSVNKQGDVWRIEKLKETNITIKIVSFEPLLENINVKLEDIDWIIIGAQTRPNKQPSIAWVENLIIEAKRQNIPIFLKHNLEFPK